MEGHFRLEVNAYRLSDGHTSGALVAIIDTSRRDTHLILTSQFWQTIGNKIMNIVEQGLAHFEGGVPQIRELRTAWPTHHLNLGDDEYKGVELIKLYSIAWHQILMLRMNERLLQRMSEITQLASEVNHTFSKPLDIALLLQMYNDAKIENELRKKKRNDARRADVLDCMIANHDKITALNERAKLIADLALQLEKDKEHLSYNIGNHDLYLTFNNNNLEVSDRMTDIQLKHIRYNYDTDTKKITEIINVNNSCDCECKNCCECD